MTVEKLPREQWTALIHDAHPGYISWETFEANQQALALNAAAHARETNAARPAKAPLCCRAWPSAVAAEDE